MQILEVESIPPDQRPTYDVLMDSRNKGWSVAKNLQGKVRELEALICAQQAAHAITAEALESLLGKLEVMSGCNEHNISGPEEYPEFSAARSALEQSKRPIGDFQVDVYAFVRGGVLQGMRCNVPASATVVDYDNMEGGEENEATGEPFDSEEEFERDKLGGITFEELETKTHAIF